MKQLTPLAVVLCTAALPAMAAHVLFDFESPSDVSLWHNENSTALGADKKLEQSSRFVASGRSSMRFFTPAWRPDEHGGRQKWPAFEGTPPLTDWSRYDRLVLELVNVTGSPQRLMLFITDGAVPTRSGLQHREVLEPYGYAQAVVDLRNGFAAKKVNPRDIRRMHFYTEDPPVDMALHLDRLILLEPGEEAPKLPAKFQREFAELQAPGVEATRSALAAAGERARKTAAGTPTVAAWAADRVAELRRRLTAIESRPERTDESVLQLPGELAALRNEAAALDSQLAMRLSFERVRPRVQVAEGAADHVVVGFVTSMEKILPRNGPVPIRTDNRHSLMLAKNESESFQVVVVPCGEGLREVSVNVRDLRSQGGVSFPRSAIHVSPVGYVDTKTTPPYGSPHVGWWPDPILTFMDRCDIAKGDAQSFWVKLRAPKDQAAGQYAGKLDVTSQDRVLFSFDLAVQVYPFAVPDKSPLPLAITFAPHDHPLQETKDLQAKWRESEEYPINAWKKHKSQWADFLADYYITYDSLYRYGGWTPAFEELSRLHKQGRLGRFNLGYYGILGDTLEAREAWIKSTLTPIKAAYDKAKELGLLDQAYIYGCDEHPADKFSGVERAAEALKKACPGVTIMTTTYDHSFGTNSIIKSMDAFCPLTPRFDSALADKVRAQGQQVWWYICCGPRHPHANMFVEYPAIEGRILMGAQTAKYRPDGFLYYQISIWNSRKPIDSGPFTDWDPRSWTTYHGDGSWTCVGPDGTPLPTLRLENFRDGLEDYAYFRVLQATVAKVEASPKLRRDRTTWLATAKAALEVPEELVESMTVFTLDSQALYRWRNRLAAAVAGSGTAPADPWRD